MIVITLFVSCIACKGQINSKENKDLKSNETVDSNSLVDHSIQKDSTVYNQYKNEKKEGLWKEFDKNDQLISEGYYADGKANGLMKWYYEGDLVAMGNMKNDKRDGLWKICDVHHKSNCIEASFKDDKKVGIWKILYANGKLWKEQNWEDDKMISEKCWDESGNKIDCNSNVMNH